MGAIDGFAASGMKPAVYALEPTQSPMLTTGKGGEHMVEGIALGFVPLFLDLSLIEGVRAINQDAGFEMCRWLAKKEGILAGDRLD